MSDAHALHVVWSSTRATATSTPRWILGCETVLTGISATAARTIVMLGIDVSSLHTRSRLKDGLDLAIQLTA